MKSVLFVIFFILFSVFALADTVSDDSSSFNLSGFVKKQGDNLSFAKLLGAIILAFLLISGILYVRKRKKKS